MLWQLPLPHRRVRGNSLAMRGDILLMAYQAYDPGGKPAGFQVYDISKPAEPREITFYDLSGNDDHSVGVHYVSFMDGRYAHICSSHPDFVPNHKDDNQFYQIIDLANPSRPTEVGRWWLPGQRKGDKEPPLDHHVAPSLHFGMPTSLRLRVTVCSARGWMSTLCRWATWNSRSRLRRSARNAAAST